MPEVTSLGYVVITAEDLQAWSGFASEVLGLAEGSQPSPGPDRETLYLRTDDRSWRLAVEQGANGGLAALGLEVRDQEALASLRVKLEQAGIAVKDAPELAASRQVLGLLQAADPAGLPLEFFYGAKGDKASFVSPTGARFVTGDQGVGHGVLMVSDVDEAYNFYVGLLGFRLSDVIAFGPMKLHFTSPSPRHHTIAFGGFPGVTPGLQHIMLEVDAIDTVGRALDRVYDNGTPLQSGLGRHTNDHMLSFYCVSPSGLTIEYGWGGRQIDNATHTTTYYDAASYWGHRRPDGTDPMRAREAAAPPAS
jgi:3,4-dihydroxy-9,10-secoandrosta-1,3,5(10)-triene-9,17-dione 4,5-dioxygenase